MLDHPPTPTSLAAWWCIVGFAALAVAVGIVAIAVG